MPRKRYNVRYGTFLSYGTMSDTVISSQVLERWWTDYYWDIPFDVSLPIEADTASAPLSL